MDLTNSWMYFTEGEKIEMKIGNRILDFSSGRFYIMGILNITPDSFSDGGKYFNMDKAMRQAERMISEGVDIIDVGGESTRPGYTKISEEEEIDRIVPVIEALKSMYDVPVSVDTYKWRVAKAVLSSGADMINDIWGLDYYEDPEHRMAKLVASANIPICIMHNCVEKMQCQNKVDFSNILINDMKKRISIAKDNGVLDKNIIVDPGVGFAKSLDENIWSIHVIKDLKQLGYPVLLGISNKSIIGDIGNLPVDQRKEGTIVLNVLGRQYGGNIFRVHDVKSNKNALNIIDRILLEK